VATFIDRHRVSEVDPSVRYQLHLEAVHGIRDPSGALPLGHWVEDGAIYCVIDARDEDSVRQHHAARGIAANDLHRISGLPGARPLSLAEEQVVRDEIKRLWHPAQARNL
jgi:hypothetical protein